MEEKNSFSERLSDFFAGKGFYIVLLLCAALIATSIWLMADGSRADVETNGGETEYRITEDGPDHAGDLPVMSVSGQLIYSTEISATAGENSYDLNVENLSAGIYYYTMEYKGQRLVRKMNVVK